MKPLEQIEQRLTEDIDKAIEPVTEVIDDITESGGIEVLEALTKT
jgi:hypothetical protein